LISTIWSGSRLSLCHTGLGCTFFSEQIPTVYSGVALSRRVSIQFSLTGQETALEDNADGHLKLSIMGREVLVAVTAGKLDFGPWEQIFYGEFDGRRRKRVLLKIIGE
jgi:secondary thiamine-phosphate synthase enzyme